MLYDLKNCSKNDKVQFIYMFAILKIAFLKNCSSTEKLIIELKVHFTL